MLELQHIHKMYNPGTINEICLFERLGYDPESLAEDFAEGARNKKRFHDAGFPFTFGGMCPETFDVLAFGRGMMDFFVDLCERPETICAILDMMLDEYEENSEQQVREAVAVLPPATSTICVVTCPFCVKESVKYCCSG